MYTLSFIWVIERTITHISRGAASPEAVVSGGAVPPELPHGVIPMKNLMIGAAGAFALAFAITPAAAQTMPSGLNFDVYAGGGISSFGLDKFKSGTAGIAEGGANIRYSPREWGGLGLLIGAAVQTGGEVKKTSPYSFTIPQPKPLASINVTGTETESFRFGTALVGKAGVTFATGPWMFGLNGLVMNQNVRYKYTDISPAVGPIPGFSDVFTTSRSVTRFGGGLSGRYTFNGGFFLEAEAFTYAPASVKIDGDKATLKQTVGINARIGISF
jgi:hypothetical protein